MKLKKMKKCILLITILLISLISFSFIEDIRFSYENAKADKISFKIKGTGSKGIFVEIGIGSSPGYGACCSGVSEHSTVSFTGELGDVIYDGKTRRVITKIYKELEGTTINLAEYY
jgi:hypothetical protein